MLAGLLLQDIPPGVRQRKVSRLLDVLDDLASLLVIGVTDRPVAHRAPLAVVETHVSPRLYQTGEYLRVAAVARGMHRGAAHVAASGGRTKPTKFKSMMTNCYKTACVLGNKSTVIKLACFTLDSGII